MFTIDDIRNALGDCLRSERPGAATEFTGVTNDSRVAKPGDLFVALTTPIGYAPEVRDGHDFIGDAVARGVTGLMLQHEEISRPDHVWAFLVTDTKHAIGELGRAWRSRFDARTIAIAGNVGKTTTKELTAAVLQNCGHTVLKSPMNFNDEIGLAMTLFQLNRAYDRLVVEVGMFELGEIRRLCQIAQPRIGVVLNVGPTHLARLGSMEAIAAAKQEAVQDLPAEGYAILSADDPVVAAMAATTHARVLTFGLHAGADFRASEIQSHGLAGVEFTLSFTGHDLRVRSPLPGARLVPNALAAIAVAVADGAGIEQAAAALTGAQVTPRLQAKIAACGATILDDSYNANPVSMMAALDVLREMPGRRHALLGDMLDLGSAETGGHRSVGEHAAGIVDTLYTIGPRGAQIATAAHETGARRVRHFDTKEEAIDTLRATLGPNDTLLIKASRGMALGAVVAELIR
ncbi:MAG: UDP-N-acetylmuramoyl-tripeptide--D-alanyl-D-alanine ligase [Thermomicrobiales bacterium]|nr:UDP-N-acetylmuramoyl-tripeptide--D-alanyl-D-alanine ligase [Thermomicrobiales bacterium]MCO5220264.1 UDP-N-acetylmuramoyl-tripeptide--D-alanyl-D-alanine ligase [Thermomicrobiales bacterium]